MANNVALGILHMQTYIEVVSSTGSSYDLLENMHSTTIEFDLYLHAKVNSMMFRQWLT